MPEEQGPSKPGGLLEQLPPPNPEAKKELFDPEVQQWFKDSLDRQLNAYSELHPDKQVYGFPPGGDLETFWEICKIVREDFSRKWEQQAAEDSTKVDVSQAPEIYVDDAWDSIRRSVSYYLFTGGELSEHAKASAGYAAWLIRGGWQQSSEEIYKRWLVVFRLDPWNR